MKFGRKKSDSQARKSAPTGSANVFSYYASRSSNDTSTGRHGQTSSKGHNLINWQTLPIVLATSVIIGSLAYLFWVDINPRIEFVNTSSGSEEIMQSTKTYEKAARELLAESPLNRFKPTVNTNKLANDLKARFPELAEVSITTPIASHRLIFEIQATTPALALSLSSSNFIIVDERGRAVLETQDTQKVQAVGAAVVTDDSGITVREGDYVLTRENISFITEAVKQLQAKKVVLERVILPQVANELHIKPTQTTYYVKFNMAGDARLQAGSYIAALQRLTGEGTTPTEYIDVRVPEKVFYK